MTQNHVTTMKLLQVFQQSNISAFNELAECHCFSHITSVNPGPPAAAAVSAASNTTDILRLGVLHVRSAANKVALIHDIVDSHNLDLLVLTETWFTDDMPRSVTADVAPAGFSVVHCCRRNGVGGGVSLSLIHI